MQTKLFVVKNFIRALRLPFVSASILPFIFGSLIERNNFNTVGFLLGSFAVIFTHLSANLINDYEDSKTGADWQDKNYYGFFGGSKLIQEEVFSERFYLKSAIICAAISFLSVCLISLQIGKTQPLIYYLIIIFLSWQYSKGPLSFSYRRLGELIIFLLFGPALVMGGYFIQTGIFPDLRSFVLSWPFGFFTVAILFSNEIPDFIEDKRAKKFTWVALVGRKEAFLLYYMLMAFAFSSIVLSIYLGYLNLFAALSLLFFILVFKAAGILRKFPHDKEKLQTSSKLTILIQNACSVILIASILI